MNAVRKDHHQVTLWFFLIILITVEIGVLLGIGLGINTLFEYIFAEQDTSYVTWLLIINATLATTISVLLNQTVLIPLKRISNAMRAVSKGDFTICLKSQSHIREVQEIYETFNMMVSELSQTEVIQTDFVSNVSHEIKTPISAIEGYAMLLSETAQTAEQADYIDRIINSSQRLSGLIGNILLLSRVENKTIATNQKSYRLDEQIRQSIVLLESMWSPKNIELDVEMDEIEYFGVESLLMHVWNNLISNAIKFNRPGGLLKIRLFRKNNQIQFVIADQGCGISEEAMNHIFDKFYQADASHKQEGNGLGLALVKRILVLLDGDIQVINLPERGCQFTVTLTDTMSK